MHIHGWNQSQPLKKKQNWTGSANLTCHTELHSIVMHYTVRLSNRNLHTEASADIALSSSTATRSTASKPLKLVEFKKEIVFKLTAAGWLMKSKFQYYSKTWPCIPRSQPFLILLNSDISIDLLSTSNIQLFQVIITRAGHIWKKNFF